MIVKEIAMKRSELSEAVKVARSDKDLSKVEISHFDGFGLFGFKPVHCTIDQLAALVRWQAIYLNGNIDAEALEEIATLGAKRFLIV